MDIATDSANFRVRKARPDDARSMSAVLKAIMADTGRQRPHDPAFVCGQYLDHPHQVVCTLALDPDGTVLGFQSLKRAWAGNPYGIEPGWGAIGTHIAPAAQGRGVGRRLFIETRRAAAEARMIALDATIGADNAGGLGYYEAMGFRTYRTCPGAVHKRFDIAREGQDR